LNYLEIANAPILFVVVGFILLLLCTQSIVFYKMSKKEALAIGVPAEKMKKAVQTASVNSIVPSIAIIIGLISLSPALGLPISWARLAMVGSLMYETTAAGIAAQVGGSSLNELTPTLFATIACVMTLGVLPAFLYPVLFLRPYKAGLKKAAKKDTTLMNLLISTILMCVYVSFIAPPVLSGGAGRTAAIVSAVIMALFTVIINIAKGKANWLKEYAVSLSLIGAIVFIIVTSIGV